MKNKLRAGTLALLPAVILWSFVGCGDDPGTHGVTGSDSASSSTGQSSSTGPQTSGGGEGGAGGTGGMGGAGPDVTPPVVKLGGPIDGSLLRTARLLVPVEAKDEGGLARVWFSLNDATEIDLDISKGALVASVAVDVRPRRGENALVVFAEDLSGNRTETPLKVAFERRLAAGGSHTGAIAGGQVFVWGRNNLSQLGLGGGDVTSRFVPEHLAGLDEITAIDFRQNQSLALHRSGSLFVWGNNADGRLGLGAPDSPDTTTREAPTQIPTLSGVLAATFGFDHTLVLIEDGTVRAFGDNSSGQLGDGSIEDRHYPVTVAGLDDVIQLAGGSKHSVALRRDGTVWAWGRNQYGNLGQANADTDPHPMPVQIPGLVDVVHIASGRDHILALRSDGTVAAWGLNQNGQVGNGMSGADANVFMPISVIGLTGAIAVMADGNYSFALRKDGTAVGWGQNFNGQLGIASDDTSDRSAPEGALSLSSVTDIEPGATHAIGVAKEGSVYTWGWSTNGSLGRSNLLNNWAYPVPGQITLP
jgi:alpha-tubulin suppressor-like RCC1 family protein